MAKYARYIKRRNKRLATGYADRTTIARTSMVAGQIVTHDLSELVSLHVRKLRLVERFKDSHRPVRRYSIASASDSARIGFDMGCAVKCASAE